jgi:menaquinone-dependent protoporphyrinogen oxidase
MKVLVAVASKHGSTREIAETIAQELQASGLSVDLREVGEVTHLDGYDAVVLGSAVYAGHWLLDAKHFAERLTNQLLELPVWLFSSGPVGDVDPQPLDDPNQLAASMADVKVRDHHVFVGKIDFARLGWAERMVVKAFKSPIGDFRDWNEIRDWARGIAYELRAEPIHAEP